MDNDKIQFSEKYLKVKEKLTLFEKKVTFSSNNPCSESSRIFVIEEMTFRFKLFLKDHGVKYTAWKNRPGYIVVNQPNFPRLIFEFDEMNYVKIVRIPQDNYQFNLLVYSEKDLIVKMLRLRILDISTVKRMYTERKKKAKEKKQDYAPS